MSTVTVHVAIGNSDDKLTQKDWSMFAHDVDKSIRAYADVVHGQWFSAADAPWQNACWGFEIKPAEIPFLRNRLARHATIYSQDSIAFTEGHTIMVEGTAEVKAPAGA